MKTLTEIFNEITVKRGESFMIDLAENPSTGHRWKFQIVRGKAQKLDDKFKNQTRIDEIGQCGKRRMTYQAIGKKDIVIQAQYKREWEKTPAGELTFKVKVR